MSHCLFLIASAHDSAADGNTERLARHAAAHLPAMARQTWLRLAGLQLPPFVDQRHCAGTCPPPESDLAKLLQATLACSDLVLVAPVYWYSFPAALKTCLDHWSAWLRVPGLAFKEAMSRKTLHLQSASGDRAKAQPIIDSAQPRAGFFPLRFGAALWGKGALPGAIDGDAAALAEAEGFFGADQKQLRP